MAGKKEQEPDPRLDGRSAEERAAGSQPRDPDAVPPQQVSGPDLAGQAAYTAKYLADKAKG